MFPEKLGLINYVCLNHIFHVLPMNELHGIYFICVCEREVWRCGMRGRVGVCAIR